MQIKQRYFNEEGKISGLIIARSFGEVVGFGWSFCNPKDKYVAKTAELICESRLDNDPEKKEIPSHAREFVNKFIERAKRYFKNQEVVFDYQCHYQGDSSEEHFVKVINKVFSGQTNARKGVQ